VPLMWLAASWSPNGGSGTTNELSYVTIAGSAALGVGLNVATDWLARGRGGTSAENGASGIVRIDSRSLTASTASASRSRRLHRAYAWFFM